MGTGKKPERAIQLPANWLPRLKDVVHEKWVNGKFVDTKGRRKMYFDIYEFIGVTRKTISKSDKPPYQMTLRTFQTISREVGYTQYEELLERLKGPPGHTPTPSGQLPANDTADIARLPTAKSPETLLPAEVQEQLDKAKGFTEADNFSEAIPVLEDALIKADSTDHLVAKVKARTRLAHALYEAREDFIEAEQRFREALRLVPTERLDLLHNVLHGLGDILLFSGRLDEAKATINASLDAANKSGRHENVADSLISAALLDRALGFCVRANAQLDEATQLLLKRALTDQGDEKRHDAHSLAVCYINKALLHRDMGNLHEALPLYGKAEEQYEVSGYKLDAGKALLFCGELHCANADWSKGYDCFRRALQHFEAAGNSMWGARALEHVSRLHATHEDWEPAVNAALQAAEGAKESGRPDDQVDFLLLAASLLWEWKVKSGRKQIVDLILKSTRELPENQRSDAISRLTQKMGDMTDAVESAVRNDEQVRELICRAKTICEESRLKKELADCLLKELHLLTPSDDNSRRRDIRLQAIEHLKGALEDARFPKRRAHLMGRIHAMYMELGERGEAIAWLKRAGEVFEATGDIYGLANYHGSLAEMHRADGRVDSEVAEYRIALALIEGRSFHRLLAGTQINLAAALRFDQQFDEAQMLLTNAEALCEQHHFKDFIPAIARSRDSIETWQQASQAPEHTLQQLLDSLQQLVQYRPEKAVDYLPFWYYVWQTEVLAVVRSGPHLSFMIVTDDVEQFMRFSAEFSNLASHFLMVTSQEPTVRIEAGLLSIPPTWLFPKTFRFIGVRKRDRSESRTSPPLEADGDEGGDTPTFRIEGPATMLPVYSFVGEDSDVEGGGKVMALAAPRLPQMAIDLMIGRPTADLIRHRAIWFPSARFESKDPFLTDLRIAHERTVFPVYFDRMPASEGVSVIGTVEITIAREALKSIHSSVTERWERSLLKLARVPRQEARAALFDLPDVFSTVGAGKCADDIRMEVHLLEFEEIGRRIFHPTLLIRDQK